MTNSRPSTALGLVTAAGGIAGVTALIYPLRAFMPVASAGVVYLLVVLVVSIGWGFRLGLLTCLMSTTAFNFFHIPPVGRLSVADSQDWIVLLVFLVSSALTSGVAQVARSAVRNREELQSELVEAEAVRRSDEMKTALLHAVSHDLRSPLTAIAAAGAALASPTLEADEREQLAADVTAGATGLSELVDKLLDLSKLQAGSADPRTDWCSVEDTVRSAADQLPTGVTAPRINCAADVPLIRADAAQLERVFFNLFENAYRHAGEAPDVRVFTTDGRVIVSISDKGPGVPPIFSKTMFEPFVGTGGGDGGSGLGLAIARGFTESNGGILAYEISPGGGSVFTVSLEIENARAEHATAVAQ